MKFLEKLDFNIDDILELEEVVPFKLKNVLINQKKLVTENILYLKEIGVTNYKEIFIKYYDMFLMDNSNFTKIFNKYEPDDLINKLKQNINIVEYL